MGRQSSGPRKVMVRLEYAAQRILPVPARFVNVQLAELFEHLPPGHLSPARSTSCGTPRSWRAESPCACISS